MRDFQASLHRKSEEFIRGVNEQAARARRKSEEFIRGVNEQAKENIRYAVDYEKRQAEFTRKWYG